ncbi:enoyl-CoA hydratase isomerase family [Rhizoctonia solani]|uniref:3-hydroxyisobutyryl-CoA hydrolase n=1 Tax=Rhizoctonia solani TaxID=456999 RepID=A0A8H7HBT4_9AGAM|nr:enoyl-CoA hydratase isomerase family [Rhizoctonia solani]
MASRTGTQTSPPPKKMAHFPKIESQASESHDFRRVLWTGEHSQLVIMTIPVDGEIGEEVHTVDQHLMFTSGTAKAIVAGEEKTVKEGDLVIVPAGTKHNFINTAKTPLVLYTVYAPAEHATTSVHKSLEEGEKLEEAGKDEPPAWAQKDSKSETRILSLAWFAFVQQAPMMLRPLALNARRTAVSMSSNRLQTVARHLSGTAPVDEAVRPVLFKSEGNTRTYILNRPAALNTLNENMIDMLGAQIKEWNANKLCNLIIGRGNNRAFCAGGDVKDIIMNAATPEKQPEAIRFFKKEFELDFALATLTKPYVSVMDGYTMGGGVGLSIGAPFRIATEASSFAMPEAKIGYSPDVGATYFLPRLDGELGTYLALTSNAISGRTIYEFGLATHFVPQRRLPTLLAALSSLADTSPEAINRTIEEHSADISPEDPSGAFRGERRKVLDACFSYDRVESIIKDLQDVVSSAGSQAQWAQETLDAMLARSPTSLRVALQAVRRGKHKELADALQMEMGVATAFCTGASPDFITGVTHLLVNKQKTRAAWSPDTLEKTPEDITNQFFDQSPYVQRAPRLDLDRTVTPGDKLTRYALPNEATVEAAVKGSLPGSGSFALTPTELISSFERRCGQKAGLKQKIQDIIGELVASKSGYERLLTDAGGNE